MKILFSYTLLCSRKGFKFSDFCLLSITGYQNGYQNLLSKFSTLFTRTEQAGKWEAPCTSASASNSTAGVCHTKLPRNRIRVCGKSVQIQLSATKSMICGKPKYPSEKALWEYFLLWLVTPSAQSGIFSHFFPFPVKFRYISPTDIIH